MHTCDSAKVTVLVDNYIDMLLPNESSISRQGMPEHFAARRGTPLAENGIAFLIETTANNRTTTILLDAGMSPVPLLHNVEVLGIDLYDVDQIVISHGHPDHFGGIYSALAAIGRPTPLYIHPAAFRPRFINHSNVVMPYFNVGLNRTQLEAAGGRIVEIREPIALAPGVSTSGEIPTLVDFEKEVPGGRQCVQDGKILPDHIEDYMSLIINVRDRGLIILEPCGHSGVISSILNARNVSSTDRVHAVMGGFHLGHAGISQDKVDQTVAGLAEFGVGHISPMHCSGMRTIHAVATQLPAALKIMTVGTVVRF